VELAGDDAGDGRLRRDRADSRAAAPQLLIPIVPVGKVAHHSRKPPQLSAFILKRRRDGVGPETRSVLSQLPAFSSQMAFGGCPFELILQSCRERIFAGIEE